MAIIIEKMRAKCSKTESETANKLYVSYSFNDFNIAEGQKVCIRHTGKFFCNSCGKNVKKLFDAYCFTCLRTKASADVCVMSPHKCHFENGTCREPNWGEEHCYQPHCVYVSHTDKFKIGITRETQVPTRWIDQGANSATIIAKVPSRHIAGTIEKSLSAFLSDKTHWMKMLLNFDDESAHPTWTLMLEKIEREYLPQIQQSVLSVFPKMDEVSFLSMFNFKNKIENFVYPRNLVSKSLQKVVSLNLDKTPTIEGEILGIKGQYLYLNHGVVNIRRHTGYEAELIIS